MATITKPMALDESFNTTESTSRNQADVLVGIESAIRQGFGQVASAVEYDNTDSGLTADNVQEAIDEVDDTVDGLVDDVTEISSDIESTKTATGNPLTLTDAAPINSESLVVELEPIQEGSGDPSPTNIRPITGYTECEVDDVGFNQWDEEWELGIYDTTTGAKSDSTSRIRSKNYIKVLPNTIYNFVSPSADTLILLWYDGDKNLISIDNSSALRTSPNNAYYLNFYTYNNTVTYNHDICINISKTTGTPKNGDYEPYHSSNATIQFGQTVYGGVSNFTEGGTDDELGIADLGSLSWVYSDGYFKSESLNSFIKRPSSNTETPKGLCEGFKVTYWNDSSDNAISITPTPIGAQAYYLWIKCSRYSDATTFKNAVSGVNFAYEKETPSTIATPPTELKLLKGTNNITTNGTTINLGYQPDNVIGDAKEKADKINFSEIVKYTISGNTAELIPLVIDGTAHNNIPIVTDITKYRMLCVELVLKPSTAITGVYFSAIAFTDGIYLPSGISIPVYIPAGMFYANVTINPDGNGGFQLSYTAINQSQSTPPDYYSIRVRAFNQY